jgi:arylsulfatase A-like enzyme
MKRLLFASATLAAAMTHAADRPNILFIMTDDHAAHAISAYGSKVNQTPHMDRLAKKGTRFTNAFVTNSICTPSRATLLTGKYSHANGTPVFNNFDGTQQTVAKLLQSAGYHTGMVGKWHLGSNPTGFDRWIVLPGQGAYNEPAFLTPEGRLTIKGYATDVITDLGVEFLETRPKDKPFLLFLHHKAPHRDWTPSEKYAAEFRKKKIPEPETLRDNYDTRPAALPSNRQTVFQDLNHRDLKVKPPEDIPGGPKRQGWWEVKPTEVTITAEDGSKKVLSGKELDDWKYQRYMQDYLACVQSVDDGLGKVLDYLEKSGLAENTIVFYTSDNGFFLGDMGMYDKRFMYEPSLRVPLLAAGPGVKADAVNEAFALNVDFAPTFLDLAGLEVPEDMHGRSLVPVLKGEPPADWRTSMYYRYYHDPGHHNTRSHLGIRTATHKLIHYWKLDAWELFDLEKDPNEQKNIYGDPAAQPVIEKLKTELKRLQQELKDEEQFANSIPKDGVDAPRNVPKLGVKTVDEAIKSAGSTAAAGAEQR